MSAKDTKDFPETGWGVPFGLFFDESVRVHNMARNGRSTRTFIEEGRWAALVAALRPGDFVLIQFGHNDESLHKPDRYTPPEDYRANLARMVDEARATGASVILMTPVVRRYFSEDGKLEPSHSYPPLVRALAAEQEVTLIDMEQVTRDYFASLGDRDSALRFMHIAPGLHPNYPNGVRDDTHFNQLGAREVAQLVLLELRAIDHPLVSRLRPVDPKHLQFSY